MKIPLLKASFVGSRQNLRVAIDALKKTASFHVVEYKKIARNDDAIDLNAYDALVAKKRALESACNFAQIGTARTGIEYTQLETFAEKETEAMQIATDLEKLAAEFITWELTIEKNKTALKELRDYMNLPVAFDMLTPTKSVSILCGVMPTHKYEQFKNDFDFSKMKAEAYPATKGYVCIVLTSHREDAAIADVIHNYDFIPCHFNYDKTAPEMVQVLTQENNELTQKLKEGRAAPKATVTEIDTLKAYYDYISNLVDTMDLVANTLQTQKYYVLNGYVIAANKELVETTLKEVCPEINVKFGEITEGDDAPVYLKSNPIIEPFQNITNMYGAPGHKDLDPNPFVAFFYFLFFGMMIADVGYAIVLGLGVAAFIYFKKPQKAMRNFLLLFGICSVSVFAWGLIFGSAFGFSLFKHPILEPMDGATGGAKKVLLLALFFGTIQICVGFILNTIRMFQQKKYKTAVIKALPRSILFVGLILFLPKMALNMFGLPAVPFFNAISPVGMWITVVGAAGTAITNPYSLVSYLNDVISYVRLFALALVGCVLSYVGITIGTMLFGLAPGIGHIIGAIVIIAFNVLNLGLGLLGAYVHGARLQFIEFFSKFYDGDGRAFAPIGGNMRYTYIKGGK